MDENNQSYSDENSVENQRISDEQPQGSKFPKQNEASPHIEKEESLNQASIKKDDQKENAVAKGVDKQHKFAEPHKQAQNAASETENITGKTIQESVSLHPPTDPSVHTIAQEEPYTQQTVSEPALSNLSQSWTAPSENSPKKRLVNIPSFEARNLIWIAIAISIVYSLFFTGIAIKPHMTLPIFVILCFVVLMLLLGKNDMMHNKKAFAFMGMGIAFSIPAFLFGTTDFSIFNLILIHLCFAATFVSAKDTKKQDVSNLMFLGSLFSTIFANPLYGFQTIGCAFRNEKSSEKRKSIFLRVLLGIAISIPLLIIIIGLLSSADENFQYLIQQIGHWIAQIFTWNFVSHLLVVLLVTVYLLSYFQKARQTTFEYESLPAQGKADTVVSITILSLLNIVFLMFCVSQFSHFIRIGSFSYTGNLSTFTREGFFQLLFVSVINFVLVLLFHRFVRNMSCKKVIKALLIALCIFTGVLIASSYIRLYFYIHAYGFTQLRYLVAVFLAMELIMILVTIVGLIGKIKNIVKAFIPIIAVFYLIANIVGTPLVIAKTNVLFMNRTVASDANYEPIFSYTNLTKSEQEEKISIGLEYYYNTDFSGDKGETAQVALRQALIPVCNDIQLELNRYQDYPEFNAWQNLNVTDSITYKRLQLFIEQEKLGTAKVPQN